MGCTDYGKAVQPGAGLAKLKELAERQGWRGPYGLKGTGQNPQEDIPTLVYNALLAKLTNE